MWKFQSAALKLYFSDDFVIILTLKNFTFFIDSLKKMIKMK